MSVFEPATGRPYSLLCLGRAAMFLKKVIPHARQVKPAKAISGITETTSGFS